MTHNQNMTIHTMPAVVEKGRLTPDVKGHSNPNKLYLNFN
jgi:hypothetical protein